MKKILFSSCLLSSTLVFSQEWCNPGATWKYNYVNFGVSGYTEITYSGDTTINSQPAKKLEKTTYVFNFFSSMFETYIREPEYTYEDNGVAYLRYNNSWDTLFNINANIGDQWKIAKQPLFGCDSNSVMTVTNTGVTTINSQSLKYIVVEYFNSMMITDTIIEKIGPTLHYMLPYDICPLDLNEGGPFRCFYDDLFTTYMPYYNENCDFIVGQEELDLESTINIWPNPTNDILHVTSLTNSLSTAYTICDLKGCIIKQGNIKNGIINVQNLPLGVYILKFKNKQLSSFKKFIKI